MHNDFRVGTSDLDFPASPDQSPAALFQEAVVFTRDKSPASFDQWFSGVEYESFTDGVLALRARDEFVREWVEQHFLPTLIDFLRVKTGLAVQPAWSVGGVMRTPIAEGRAPEPVRPHPMRASIVSEGSASTVRAPASVRPPPSVRLPPAPPVEGLHRKNTFENFVVGPSNQLAHAAAIAAAGGGGPKHNPLFLCGGTGLGKTHLVHAVAHRVRAEKPDARILYISAERFVNEFISSVQNQKMVEFRAKYRDRCDLLLVDDIQFLASKTQTQEEFFHVFNSLHQADKPIIVTSDTYPQQLERMEERLVSRFSWGMVADIQGPEFETRVAILRKKAQAESILLPDDVVVQIAQAVKSNVRELEGTLIRMVAKSSLLNVPIDVEFVRRELGAGVRITETSVDDIQRAVCHHFKLKSQDLLSKDRHKSVAFARHVAMYLCKTRLKCSFPELGRAFGNRDHTTVMSAVRKVEGLRDADAEVRAHLEVLERKLGSSD